MSSSTVDIVKIEDIVKVIAKGIYIYVKHARGNCVSFRPIDVLKTAGNKKITPSMLHLVKGVLDELFKKGYIDTMQATIVIPYPGTPLYRQCTENDWFQVDPTDYEKFDMRHPVMQIPFSNERLLELTQSLYSSFFTPSLITFAAPSTISLAS